MRLRRISLVSRRRTCRKLFGESADQKLGYALPGIVKDDIPRLAVFGPVYGRVLIRYSRRQEPAFANILLCAAIVKAVEKTECTVNRATVLQHSLRS